MNCSVEPTQQCQRDLKNFSKKHPDEYMATMQNLEKYHVSLCDSKHPRLVQSGFLHTEPKGIVAIDQSGGILADGKK